MKYPNTGPYNFCLRLGQELLHQKQIDETLTFLISKKTNEVFGKQQNYFRLGIINKLYLPWSRSRFVGKTNKFDLWHSTYQSTMYFPLNKRTKVVYTILDLNFLHEYPGRPENKQHLSLIQDRINRADHIVCISQFCLDDVKKHLTLEKPSSVIYIGGDFTESSKIALPSDVPKNPFLFSLGTIYPKKNFHVLPALLQGNNYDLIIAGIDSSNYKEAIIAEAKKFNVLERVKFTGPVSESEKTWYYKNCTAFLFPSIAEGFGLPVIEAMAHGKPVFLSTHTALPEIGGEHAYYFQDFVPENMQKTFASGLTHFQQTNPEERIKLWASQFSWKNTASAYFKLYRSLLDSEQRVS